jgi:hypothetical protein
MDDVVVRMTLDPSGLDAGMARAESSVQAGSDQAAAGFQQIGGMFEAATAQANQFALALTGNNEVLAGTVGLAGDGADALGRYSAAANDGNINSMASAIAGLNEMMAKIGESIQQVSKALEAQSSGFLHFASSIAGIVVGGKAAFDVFDRLGQPKPILPGAATELGALRQGLVDARLAATPAFTAISAGAGDMAAGAMARLTTGMGGVASALSAAIGPAVGLSVALAPLVLIAGAIYIAFKSIETISEIVFNGALAGGALQSSADRLSKAAHEAAGFADKLGQAQPQAQALAEVLGLAGVKTDQYISGTETLRTAVADNESQFKAMGIQTRDASGALLDQSAIAANTAEYLKTLADDGSRAWAMNELGVKSLDELNAVAAGTPEKIADMNKMLGEYRALIGQDAVEATERYDAALRAYKQESDLTWRGVKNMIDQAVMPAFTDLLEWFRGGMPVMAEITHSVMTRVMNGWYSLVLTVIAAKERILAVVDAIRPAMASIAAAWNAAINGDFRGAMDYLVNAKNAAGNRMEVANERISAKEKEFAARMSSYATAGKTGLDPNKAGRNTGNRVSKDAAGDSGGDASPKQESRMQQYEAELAERKAAYMKQHDMYEMSKRDEKQYWDDLLAKTDTGAKEYNALRKKAAELELQVLKQNAENKRGLTKQQIESERDASMGLLDIDREIAQQRYDSGQISHAQLLEQQMQFENRRYEIAKQAQERQIELFNKDPNANPVERQKLLDQLEALERAHSAQVLQVQGKMAAEQHKVADNFLDSAGRAFETNLGQMLEGTLSWKKALENVYKSLYQAFTQEVIVKPLMQMALRYIRESALYQMIAGAQVATQGLASDQVTAKKISEAGTVVSANAAEGASGGAAAMAAIPYVGPVLAVAAFAMLMSQIMSANGVVKSASGGYDIPAGLNPMTQLHEQEMVLPARYANVIRDMAAGGGESSVAGGGESHVHIHVTAMDHHDVKRALLSGGALHKALKELNRRNVSFT